MSLTLALSAMLLAAAPQPAAAPVSPAGPAWQQVRRNGECRIVHVYGAGAEEREIGVAAQGGSMVLSFWAPGWAFADKAQPNVALYFVGPGQLWPNLTAVVDRLPSGDVLVNIGFDKVGAGNLEPLLAKSQRVQLIHDRKTLGVFETPQMPQGLTLLKSCLSGR